MKKNLIIISIALIVVIIICFVGIKVNSRTSNLIKRKNINYEQYVDCDIYGTDVVTLINMAISDNEENKIEKDEKGFYINNNKNSINIDIILITDEEKQETTTYRMETISKVGITEFIKNFNTTRFKCTNIKHHSQTGKISYIEITQQYE